MDATFFARVRSDFPEIKFVSGRRFSFRAPRTVFYAKDEDGAEMLLLHEIGHAILGHSDFKTEIERLKMERAAWEEARKLAKRYGVLFDEEFVEERLDTYRDWLHKKSSCPECGLTRFQTVDGVFHCPQCDSFRGR